MQMFVGDFLYIKITTKIICLSTVSKFSCYFRFFFPKLNSNFEKWEKGEVVNGIFEENFFPDNVPEPVSPLVVFPNIA